MNLHTRYIISTVGYGVVAVLGAAAGVYAYTARNWILLGVCLLIVGVAVDNFFCGDRCRVAGLPATGEYTIPPFLRREKSNQENKQS
jgi:hypothetical protein